MRLVEGISVEELVKQRNGTVGKSGRHSQVGGGLESILNLVSNDDKRDIASDFWIFLVASAYLKILRIKTRSHNNHCESESDHLSTDEECVGALLIKIIQVSFPINCPVSLFG